MTISGTSSRKKRKVSSDLSGVLCTRLTIEYLLRTERINCKTLQEKYSGYEEQSNAIVNWLKGIHVIQLKCILKLKNLYPNNNFYTIYESPIFFLLKNKPITKNKLIELVKPYIDLSSSMNLWDFSLYQNGNRNSQLTPLCFRDDTDSLFQRGDIYGFLGILFHVRMAESLKDTDMHLLYMTEAYRAFPGLCRYHHFKNRWKEFYKLLLDIHMRVRPTWFQLKPDLKLIKSQIFAKEHLTFRRYQLRDPATYRFIEPTTPYNLAEFDK